MIFDNCVPLHTSKSWQIGEVIRGFRGTQICRNFLFDDAIKIEMFAVHWPTAAF